MQETWDIKWTSLIHSSYFYYFLSFFYYADFFYRAILTIFVMLFCQKNFFTALVFFYIFLLQGFS
jgi:hypothetical protein